MYQSAEKRFQGVCAEHCPVQQTLNQTFESLSDTATDIQTLAMEDTLNAWHASYMADGDDHDVFATYQTLMADANVARIFQESAVRTFSHFSFEEQQALLTSSRVTAAEIVSTIIADKKQANRLEAQTRSYRCSIGPQVISLTVNSKRAEDSRQAEQANFIICPDDNVVSSESVSDAEVEQVRLDIKRDRAFSVLADEIKATPNAVETLETYNDLFPDESTSSNQ